MLRNTVKKTTSIARHLNMFHFVHRSFFKKKFTRTFNQKNYIDFLKIVSCTCFANGTRKIGYRKETQKNCDTDGDKKNGLVGCRLGKRYCIRIMSRTRLQSIALAKTSNLFGVDIGILQRFVHLRLASICRACTNADGSIGFLNHEIQFAAHRCTLLRVGIGILLNGTRRQSLLGFSDAHRRALRNATGSDDLVCARIRLVHNQVAPVFGTRFPKSLILRKIARRLFGVPLRTI